MSTETYEHTAELSQELTEARNLAEELGQPIERILAEKLINYRRAMRLYREALAEVTSQAW